MRTFVVPDLHGRHDLARDIFAEAGVPFHPEERKAAGVRTVQLGDLANCVASSVKDDIEILACAVDWFDIVLVGNHEYPHIGPVDFSGFHPDPRVRAGIVRLDDLGILHPCHLIGDTLLTHAGVTAEFSLTTAAKAAAKIDRAWRDRNGSTSPLITQVGCRRRGLYENDARRFGLPVTGGILWSDWDERRADINQVHGHTPTADGPVARYTTTGHFSLNLDVGASKGGGQHASGDRIVGLWIDENGKTDLADVVETVTSSVFRCATHPAPS